MRHSLTALFAVSLLGLFVLAPAPASAQVRVSLEWSSARSGGPYVYASLRTGGAYVVGSFGHPSYRYPVARPRQSVYVGRRVRIPPGHLPGPGQCRYWYPGRPPGHQPPAFRCSDRYHAPRGYTYLEYGPGYDPGPSVYPRPEYGPHRYDDDWYEDRYEDRYDDDWYEDRYEDDRDDGRGRYYGPVDGPRRDLGSTPRAQPGNGRGNGRAVRPADAATQARWAGLGERAQLVRAQLRSRGTGNR